MGPEWRSGNVTAIRRYSPGFESRRSQSGQTDFGVEAPFPPLAISLANPWRRPRGVALDFVLNSLVGLVNQLGGPQFSNLLPEFQTSCPSFKPPTQISNHLHEFQTSCPSFKPPTQFSTLLSEFQTSYSSFKLPARVSNLLPEFKPPARVSSLLTEFQRYYPSFKHPT